MVLRREGRELRFEMVWSGKVSLRGIWVTSDVREVGSRPSRCLGRAVPGRGNCRPELQPTCLFKARVTSTENWNLSY